MRAAVFHGAGEPLHIEELSDPVPQKGEVIIKVKASGICGTDLHATTKQEMLVPAGTILGHEFCGEVVEVGPGVPPEWKQGDRLCTLPFIGCGECLHCLSGTPWQCPGKQIIGFDVAGGFAEFARVHVNDAVKLPAMVSWHKGALVEPLAVGLHAVRMAQEVQGKNVLVVGAGPIGLAVAQWCHILGARQVITSELDPARAQLALQFGASGLIQADDDIGAKFQQLSGGAPELIFECVGVPGLIAQCIDLAAFKAEIIVVGYCMRPDNFVPALAMLKEITLKFAIGNNKADFQFIVDMMTAKRVDVRPLITSVVALKDLPDTFEALRQRNGQCKVIVEPEA